MAKKSKTENPGTLFGGPVQPDLFYNGPVSKSTLQHPTRERMTVDTEYWYIEYLSAADGFKERIKTFLSEGHLLAWCKINIPNFHYDMVRLRTEPTKYQSVNQPDAYYWAEPNVLDNGDTYCVVFQADGYPSTEGFDDWFADYEVADDIAYRLAQGEDLFNQF